MCDVSRETKASGVFPLAFVIGHRWDWWFRANVSCETNGGVYKMCVAWSV